MLRAIQMLGIFLVVAAIYGWYTNQTIPHQSALSETTGRVTSVAHTHDKYGHLDGIKFSVNNAPQQFFYPSFFPQFTRANELLSRGAMVRIEHEYGGNEIRALAVEDEIVADFGSVERSRHSNGNAGLICAIAFMVAVVVLEWQIRRTA